MGDADKRIEALKRKYGAELVEAMVRAHPNDALALISWPLSCAIRHVSAAFASMQRVRAVAAGLS